MSRSLNPDEGATAESASESGRKAPEGGRHSYGFATAEAVAVFLIAIAARLPFLDHVPFKDELNHVLAARALLESGTLAIVEGAVPYERAWGFTHLISWMYRWFGESLVVGRMPSVIAAALLVTLLFLWVRSEAGRAGAWIAALLLAFSPLSITLSQWTRFYTIHALLFFVAALAIYRLFAPPLPKPRQRLVLVLLAGLGLLGAFHLQITTLVGAAGILLWIAIVPLASLWRRFSLRVRVTVFVGVAALSIAAVVAAWLSGFAEWVLARAAFADAWAEGDRYNLRFYHFILLEQYPTLWTLSPLAFLVALAHRSRAALLAGCVFGVSFVTHSLLAWKAERYLFYALPMFFALWGFAIAGALPWLRERIGTALDALFRGNLPARVRATAIHAALVGIVLFAAFGSASTSYTVKLLTVGDHEWEGWGGYRGHPDWRAAADRLDEELDATEVVLASYDVSALYGIGRVDYLLRHVGPIEGSNPDFMLRSKTTVPIVSTAEALAVVMRCHASGVAIIERTHWREAWATSNEQVDYLEAHASPIALPEGWRLLAYQWQREPETRDPAACREIRARSGEMLG